MQHHHVHGKIHYFDWVIFQFANCKRLPQRDFSTICDSEKSDMPSIAIQDGAPV